MFHRVEEMEAMPGPRFCRLTELLPAYSGALAGALARQQSAAEPDMSSPLVAVPQHAVPNGGRDVVVGTQTAIALSKHAELFEIGGTGV